MDRKDWTRIGIAAAVLLVPGGFILGATLAARRAGRAMAGPPGATTAEPSTTPDRAPPGGPTDPA